MMKQMSLWQFLYHHSAFCILNSYFKRWEEEEWWMGKNSEYEIEYNERSIWETDWGGVCWGVRDLRSYRTIGEGGGEAYGENRKIWGYKSMTEA